VDVLDFIIIVVFLLSLYWALRSGFVQPFFSELFFVGTLAVLLYQRDAFAAIINHFIKNVPTFLLWIIAFVIATLMSYIGRLLGVAVRNIPIVKPIDTFAGLVLHAFLAFIAVYLALTAMVSLDHAFSMFANVSNNTLTKTQAISLINYLKANPVSTAIVGSHQLDELQKAVIAGEASVKVDQGIVNVASFYLHYIYPQLQNSSLGPLILGWGSRLPVLGSLSVL